MTADELKAFCKEMGLTYKELAELIGMTEPSLRGGNFNKQNNFTG